MGTKEEELARKFVGDLQELMEKYGDIARGQGLQFDSASVSGFRNKETKIEAMAFLGNMRPGRAAELFREYDPRIQESARSRGYGKGSLYDELMESIHGSRSIDELKAILKEMKKNLRH